MNIKQFYPYSPRKADFEQLSYSFVARKALLEELVGSIREQADAQVLQHWMILGMRGLGKSHLIALIYQTVKNNTELKQRWIPLLMREEEQGVFSLHTLFIRFLTQLGEEITDTDKNKSEKIFDFLDTLRTQDKKQEEILESVVAFLKDFSSKTGKKFLVLMENSDDIFSKYISKINDIKRFRNILQHEKFILLIATSPTFFDEISKPSAPLYQFFRIRSLELLTFKESVELLNRWRESDTLPSDNKSDFFQFDKDDYKLRALYHLTGGNPRVLLFLYLAIKGQDGIKSAVETFSKLLEEDLSNYYLSRLRDLSSQVQPIILALAESDKNLTQKEIAQKTFLPMKSIGTAMLRLENDSLVRPVTEKKGKNTLYTLTDRLFRLWHQWRISTYNKEIIKAVVMCLAVWYKKEELEPWSKSDDVIGTYSKEALEYRTTDHFKSLWEPLYIESEAMIIKYLEKKDYPNLDKMLIMLTETGIKSGKLLGKVARDLGKKGDIDNALKAVEKCLENDKQNKKAWVDLSNLRFKQKNYSGAEEALEKAIELDPKDAKTWKLIGLTRYIQENYSEAAVAFEKAIELDPKDVETWKSLGRVRSIQENYLEAVAAFEKAVKLDPKDAETWELLGGVRGIQENYLEAAAAFKKAIELDPKNLEAWEWLGLAHGCQENYSGAEAAFKKAVELDPENAKAWKWIGRVRYNQKNYSGAEAAFEKAVELDPKDTEAWKRLGRAHFNQKNYPGAEAAFEKTLELGPKDAKAWEWLSRARYNQKNYSEAEVSLEKAVELDPKNAVLWMLLGGARSIQKNFSGAEASLKKVVELNPKDPQIWKLLGSIRYIQKNYSGAEAAFEKVVEFDQKDAKVWEWLGYARFIQKDYLNAETAFQNYIKINPFEKEIYGCLLEVLVKDDRVKDMLPTLDDVLSLKDAAIDFKAFMHFMRAFVFLYQQDRTPFLKDLNDATELLKELAEENRHEILAADTEFLTNTLQKDNINIHRAYVTELRKISTELSGVFRPIAFVLDYFEAVFSAEKDKKAKTDKSQRILDSITSEIREPVEKMINKIKQNL